MNLQSFTFPWGIPGEDCTGPRGPTQARLGVLRRTSIIAAAISSAGQTVATSFPAGMLQSQRQHAFAFSLECFTKPGGGCDLPCDYLPLAWES